MEINKCLSDAEFDVIQAIWMYSPPVSSKQIMDELKSTKTWKLQTVLTLLSRLVSKGFVKTKKVGRENQYTALITRDDYLNFETEKFVKQYHENSIVGLINTLYNGKQINKSQIDEIQAWLDKKVK